MADDLSRKVFKDYRRGYAEKDIAAKYGVNTRQVNQIVKFESAVQTRVQAEVSKIQAKMSKAPPKGKR